MKEELINVKDANGNYVVIKTEDLTEAIIRGNVIYGFSLKAILALRKQYMYRRGPRNPTPEDIKKAFTEEEHDSEPEDKKMNIVSWISNGFNEYTVLLDGKGVYCTQNPRDRDLFIAELRARINLLEKDDGEKSETPKLTESFLRDRFNSRAWFPYKNGRAKVLSSARVLDGKDEYADFDLSCRVKSFANTCCHSEIIRIKREEVKY